MLVEKTEPWEGDSPPLELWWNGRTEGLCPSIVRMCWESVGSVAMQVPVCLPQRREARKASRRVLKLEVSPGK